MIPVLVTVLGACTGAHPPAVPPSTVVAAAEPVAAAPAGHPGHVTFVDRDAGTREDRLVAEVPASVAWYAGPDGPVAVVRVEKSAASGRLEVSRYGADGALLDVTAAVPPRR